MTVDRMDGNANDGIYMDSNYQLVYPEGATHLDGIPKVVVMMVMMMIMVMMLGLSRISLWRRNCNRRVRWIPPSHSIGETP